MIKKSKKNTEEIIQNQDFNYVLILLQGAIVGLLSGLVGVGGGFLIIPALVVLSKLPMKKAIGTSLVIITANSLFGFLGEHDEIVFDWIFLAKITTFTILGIYVGMAISKKIKASKLKPAFGWFILVLGIYILFRETVLK